MRRSSLVARRLSNAVRLTPYALRRTVLVLFLLLSFIPLLSFAGVEKKYSIEFRNADIKSAVRLLAKISGKNIVVPDKIDGRITASFDNIEASRAIESVLKANGFGVAVENNVMVVITQAELANLGEDLRLRSFGLKHAKAQDILAQVQSLITARGTAVADERTNSLHVRDTPAALKGIDDLVAQLDTKGKQVLIEAKIIEASMSFVRSLGIQWGVTKTGGTIQTGGVTAVGTADSGRSLILNAPATGYSGGAPVFGTGLIIGSAGSVLSDVQLSMAEQKGDINILSRPSIVTMDNQAASIRSGAKFYISTNSNISIGGGGTSGTSSTGSNLEEIETGIELKVTPQISSGDFVKLYIEASQSEPDFTRAVGGIPAVLDNTATTTVQLKNSETTIIGGLFKVRDAKTVKGIPGLMKIPLLGNLFKSTSREKEKKELLIFITPTIIEEKVEKLQHFSEPASTLKPEAQKTP